MCVHACVRESDIYLVCKWVEVYFTWVNDVIMCTGGCWEVFLQPWHSWFCSLQYVSTEIKLNSQPSHVYTSVVRHILD